MTDFTIASFNVKNLIGADSEYYRFQQYTPEEYAWKKDWLSDQLLTMDADIVGFQEIFEEGPLQELLDETSQRAKELNDAVLPDASKRYRKRAIFRRIAADGYGGAHVAFAPNAADSGKPGQRRPGVAIVSRFPIVESEIIQDLAEPLEIAFPTLRGMEGDGGAYTLRRISRPILKARIDINGTLVTVFNCHLKSKLGEFITPEAADFPTEADLTRYDPVARALGGLRSALRRMAEAYVLRRAIVSELQAGRPVMCMGDFNDGENAVSSEIIAGEHPFKNYSWMLRHDARHANDRYSREENEQIQADVAGVKLYSAEKLFVRKSLRDMVFTAAFGGNFESIDQIFISRHFHPENAERLGEMTYFSVLNDHLTDGSHPEAPYNKLASDHGQIIAHMSLDDGKD
ncbi:endonuclease/exonuclease/phosphatase family protein [Roseobacteraceae bacterium S113]